MKLSKFHGRAFYGAAVVLLLLVFQLPARADTVTYTFTGADGLAGTNFTYVSTSGFLSFPTGNLVPTTATDFFFDGVDKGPLGTINFNSSTTIFFVSQGLEIGFNPAYSLNILGDQVLGWPTFPKDSAILNISCPSCPPPISSAPEPSSLVMLATGIAGLIFVSLRLHRI
jgi:PEP-CTERM motif-containing protein